MAYDAQNDQHHRFASFDAAPTVADHRGPPAASGDAETVDAFLVEDPVACALEAALALHQAGAGPKALRRALRQIEELIDE